MLMPGISTTIITLNEEKNIEACIRSVAWTAEVIVVDSGSTDRTVEIAKRLGARVVHNPWPGYGQQKNFAQSQATQPWVLNIDADEIVPAELARQIRAAIDGQPDLAGLRFPRKTFYLGRWIRHGGWYPNVLLRAARKDRARWTEPSVHEELKVDGPVAELTEPLDHHAFSSIQDQILTNLRFSKLGSRDLLERGQAPSPLRLILKPIGKFFETFIIKRGFLDGMAGFIISVNAAHSIFLKYAYLLESRLRRDPR